ncbi:O-antigen ligase [Caloramator quimbayensis]|uniref:O-antigen ligase n=1 Tax=Caloramator quimbayensis TaxID=1147123 RepID=A0A1T4XHF7_9CLOT|nr:O-antigen ligase family protein [Caloramator quimbayensis]SKA88575.1 O-antigen ligase [Caloramator quimbayensis]
MHIKKFLKFIFIFFVCIITIERQENIIKIPYQNYLLFVMSFFFLIILLRKINKGLLKQNIPLFLLIIICLFSEIWSIDRNMTLRADIFLIMYFIISIYLVKFNDKNEIINNFWITFSLISIINLLFIQFYPQYSIQLDETRYTVAYRGIFGHRNTLGFYSNITSLFCLYKLNELKRINKIFAIIILFINFYLLILSKSATSLSLFFLIIFLFYIQKIYKSNRVFLVCFCLVLFLNFSILFLQSDFISKIIVEKLQRDITFTGRTYIWKYSFEAIRNRFLLGYGLNAFWGDNNYSSYYVRSTMNAQITSAHNGYLDIFLNLGLVGFISYSIIIFYIVKNYIKKKYSIDLVLASTFFLLLWSFNFMESKLLAPYSIIFILQIIFYNFIVLY